MCFFFSLNSCACEKERGYCIRSCSVVTSQISICENLICSMDSSCSLRMGPSGCVFWCRGILRFIVKRYLISSALLVQSQSIKKNSPRQEFSGRECSSCADRRVQTLVMHLFCRLRRRYLHRYLIIRIQFVFGSRRKIVAFVRHHDRFPITRKILTRIKC
jgi:hypothetical protein